MDDEAANQLASAMKGDTAAFGYVAAAFREPLLAWCRQMVGESDVEDVAQEALIIAFHRLYCGHCAAAFGCQKGRQR